MCPFPSPTRALGHVVLLVLLGSTHTHLLPMKAKSPPNFTAHLHTPTGLFPAPCLFYPLLSLIILPFSKQREATGIFPKPETEPTWAQGTDQKWHPKGCPRLSLERCPQGEGPEGGCGVRKLPSPGLGQGLRQRWGVCPVLRSNRGSPPISHHQRGW